MALDRTQFNRVRPTPEETQEFKAKRGHSPGTHRIECKICGKRLWGSGLGIGSHTRKCNRWTPASKEAK